MAIPMGRGVVSLGVVSIPVALYPVGQHKDVSLHQVHRRHVFTPLGRRRASLLSALLLEAHREAKPELFAIQAVPNYWPPTERRAGELPGDRQRLAN